MSKKFLTTGELAKICDLSPVTIFRAITHHKLEAARTPGGHFRIPADSADRFLHENNIAPQKSSRIKSTILIVDDNYVELQMFKRSLETEPSFAIETSLSGYAAGFLTQSLKPHLLLLDIFLGDRDGREVAALVRSDPKLRHTKIIAITGSEDATELKAIKEWGFDGFIKKPIAPKDLLKRIKAVLK